MKVDISEVDKLKLLRALWDNSKPAIFFKYNNVTPPDYDEELAKEVVKKDYIDYFQGRLIKCDLSKNEVDPSSYDKDYGKGTFEKIVKSLAKKSIEENKSVE